MQSMWAGVDVPFFSVKLLSTGGLLLLAPHLLEKNTNFQNMLENVLSARAHFLSQTQHPKIFSASRMNGCKVGR